MAEMHRDPPAAAPPALSLAASRLLAPPFLPGSVWLVGAGPGDPGLLTLHAVHALASADVVLHDALVPAPILALAATTRLEAVGKRAGSLHTSQLAINQRLIALAEEGLRVLRLKSGDPCIFGRGGEEALALLAAGVPFRLVPGVSAGLAAAVCRRSWIGRRLRAGRKRWAFSWAGAKRQRFPPRSSPRGARRRRPWFSSPMPACRKPAWNAPPWPPPRKRPSTFRPMPRP